MIRKMIKIQCVKFQKQPVRAMSVVSIKLKQGTVIGQEKFLDGKAIYCFKGIPYAKPPLRDLRFMDPQILEKFTSDPLDCIEHKSISLQVDPLTKDKEILGTEDCLYLNVYTPKIERENLLPVMIWIHGGMFSIGSGNSDLYFPKYLVKENVIVITINYRLGLLGLLSMPTAGVYGNMMLKDQAMAIKWVHDNIEQFNGNPNNITLFGQSSGGVCVHLHTYSNYSKKYFHKAIIQSASALASYGFDSIPNFRTKRLFEILNLSKPSDPKLQIKILQEINNFNDVIKKRNSFLTNDEIRRDYPIPFKPIMEHKIRENSVVLEKPLTSMKTKNLLKIPIMIGYTSSDGMVPSLQYLNKLDQINNDLTRLVHPCINLKPDDPEFKDVANEIHKFYFNGKNLKNNIRQFIDLMTDYHFGIYIHQTAEIHALYQHESPLYFYRFSYDGGLNMYKIYFKFDKFKGPCHGDEKFYLFEPEKPLIPMKIGTTDIKMITQMSKLWTNFAKYGNPTPDSNSNDFNFKWIPGNKISNNENYSLNYLEINENSTMKTNPNKERIDFWRKIFTKYNGEFINPK